MTIQGNSLQVGQQILLACRIRALIGKKRGKKNSCHTHTNNKSKFEVNISFYLTAQCAMTYVKKLVYICICFSYHRREIWDLLCNNCCWWLICDGSKEHLTWHLLPYHLSQLSDSIESCLTYSTCIAFKRTFFFSLPLLPMYSTFSLYLTVIITVCCECSSAPQNVHIILQMM